jgi:cytoplasmic iron level regulating protein YaaA (DUF328/UPF0246 family)
VIILLSPSKKQDFKPENFCSNFSYPIFPSKTLEIVKVMKQLTAADLSKLMEISPNLAALNYKRYQDFDNSDQALKQAILAFKGDVYAYLEFSKYQDHHFEFLQNNFFILSGLYGILKPLDLIKPHRLEMGTALKVKQNNNLYELWRSDISAFINKELKKDEIIINLASNEYFNAIDTKRINHPIITIAFKEYKNDVLKTIALNAKRARSMMSNYIILNNITAPDQLKNFNDNNYKFSNTHSTATTFTFIK